MQCHASVNAAKQGRMLIAAEIDAYLFSEREKDMIEIIRFGMGFLRGFDNLAVGHGPVDVGMIGDALDLLVAPRVVAELAVEGPHLQSRRELRCPALHEISHSLRFARRSIRRPP